MLLMQICSCNIFFYPTIQKLTNLTTEIEMVYDAKPSGGIARKSCQDVKAGYTKTVRVQRNLRTGISKIVVIFWCLFK